MRELSGWPLVIGWYFRTMLIGLSPLLLIALIVAVMPKQHHIYNDYLCLGVNIPTEEQGYFSSGYSLCYGLLIHPDTFRPDR